MEACRTAHSTTKSTSDSTVTECIAKAIKELGYGVKCNIGSSEFKVDIGIIDPNNEKEYLLGILLDGENTLHAQPHRIDLSYSQACLTVLAGIS